MLFVFYTLLLALFASAGMSVLIEILTAAPLVRDNLDARQIGDVQCNVERLKTVKALGKAQSDVKKLAETATQISDRVTINFQWK